MAHLHWFLFIGYVEQFGTGIRRIMNDCREAGVPEPEFESRGDAFRTVFRRAVSPEELLSERKLNPRQFKAVKYAIEHGRLTRPDYERIAGVARATANRDLTDLTKRGVLRQGGAARRTWYEFIFSGNEKIRETILPAKLAEKPSVETKREKKVTRK